jgi:2-phosphosulfolactate phosphatase
MSNSPVQVMALHQIPSGAFTAPHRPIVLVSSSGAQLVMNSVGAEHVYLVCLRNLTAVCTFVAKQHERVAILGAGTRGAFRREDQLCCAWFADKLGNAGFEWENEETRTLVEKWRGASTEAIREGRSADYLKRTGQVHDLEFILHHQEDLQVVPKLSGDGVVVDVGE